jgi:hypothetical protein
VPAKSAAAHRFARDASRLQAAVAGGAFAIAWLLALTGSPWALAPIAAVSPLLLWPRHGPFQAVVLAGGLAVVVVLLAKDFWPMKPGWAAIPVVTAAGIFPEFGQRNPQLWPLLAQAGALATVVLGLAALQGLHRVGAITSRAWLTLLAALLTGWSLVVLVHLTDTKIYTGVFGPIAVPNKNTAATLAALGTVLALGQTWLAWQVRNLWAAGGWLGGAALGPIALAQLNSWTGVVALAAGTLTLGGSLRPRRRGLHRHAAWLWLVVFCAVGALVAQSSTLTARLAELPHDFRLRIWRDCLGLLADFPLGGAGLGSFPGLYPLYGHLELAADSRLLHPDSSWVLLAVEWGLPAALLLLAGALWLLTRRPDATGVNSALPPLVIIRAGIVAWLVAGISEIALHRPTLALVGLSLVAILPWPQYRRFTFPRWLAIAFSGCALILVAGGLQAAHARRSAVTREGFAVAHLQRDPLNARLHWLAALDAWNRRGDHKAAMAHFRAAVHLDHRSMQLAATAAQLLTPSRPAEAAWFWTEALRRSRQDRGLGRGLLAQAWRDFPEQPVAYWQEIVRAGHPALLALVASRPGVARTRLLWIWWHEQGPLAFGDPALSDDFFAALRLLPPDHPLLPAIVHSHPTGLGLDFYLRAARHLHTSGRHDLAWQALSRQPPLADLLTPGRTGETDPRFRHWQGLVDDLAQCGEHRARLRLLDEICRRPQPPPWFRAQLAQALLEAGRADEAVARLLELATPNPPR